MARIRVALTVALLALLLASAPAARGQAPAPVVQGPIASDSIGSATHNYPFGSSAQDLAGHGYVEQEFLYSGTSVAGPYTTRMVVRRPADPARFSGTVIAEWQNVTNSYDLEAFWLRSAEHVMREGDIYVAISAQSAGITSPGTGLKAWSPERYASLHVGPLGDLGMFDIFGQGLQALRTPKGADPLAGMRPTKLIATGTSQSALTLLLYATVYDPLQRIADGFLIAEGSTATLGVEGPLATDLPVLAPRVPVLWINSETDYGTIKLPQTSRYRLWEVAGTAHLDRDAHDIQQVIYQRDFGRPMPAPSGCNRPPFSQIPFKYAQNAAVQALSEWIDTGVAPPRQPALKHNLDGSLKRDGFGNAQGGIRLPQFAVPTATNRRDNTGECKLYGSSVPFDADTLQALYPTHAGYVAKVKRATRRALRQGILLGADATATIKAAERTP